MPRKARKRKNSAPATQPGVQCAGTNVAACLDSLGSLGFLLETAHGELAHPIRLATSTWLSWRGKRAAQSAHRPAPACLLEKSSRVPLKLGSAAIASQYSRQVVTQKENQCSLHCASRNSGWAFNSNRWEIVAERLLFNCTTVRAISVFVLGVFCWFL